MQVRHGDQPWYHKHWIGVFVGTWPIHAPGAPCIILKKGRRGKKKEGSFTSIQMLHTHTRQSRENPERQEEEKSGHTTGRRPKTAQGGEGNRRTSGTNLHGETDLTKTAHTPKPHDTLRRGTRGKLGTKWETSWWQTRKPKQLIKTRIQLLKPRIRALCHSRPVFKSCPNWHKTAFKFQRIRCTICLTSPDNHQKKKTTPESRVPAWVHVCGVIPLSWQKLQIQKVRFLTVRSGVTWKSADHWDPWDIRSCRKSQNGWKP